MQENLSEVGGEPSWQDSTFSPDLANRHKQMEGVWDNFLTNLCGANIILVLLGSLAREEHVTANQPSDLEYALLRSHEETNTQDFINIADEIKNHEGLWCSVDDDLDGLNRRGLTQPEYFLSYNAIPNFKFGGLLYMIWGWVVHLGVKCMGIPKI